MAARRDWWRERPPRRRQAPRARKSRRPPPGRRRSLPSRPTFRHSPKKIRLLRRSYPLAAQRASSLTTNDRCARRRAACAPSNGGPSPKGSISLTKPRPLPTRPNPQSPHPLAPLPPSLGRAELRRPWGPLEGDPAIPSPPRRGPRDGKIGEKDLSRRR